MANIPKPLFLEIKLPPPAGRARPRTPPHLPETHHDWTPAAVVQAPPGFSRQRPTCWAPAPHSPSTRVSSASSWLSLLHRNSAAEMRRATCSLYRLESASRSASACSWSVDGGRRHSSAARHLNDLTLPPARTNWPRRRGPQASVGLLPCTAPGGLSASRWRATPAPPFRQTAPARPPPSAAPRRRPA